MYKAEWHKNVPSVAHRDLPTVFPFMIYHSLTDGDWVGFTWLNPLASYDVDKWQLSPFP